MSATALLETTLTNRIVEPIHLTGDSVVPYHFLSVLILTIQKAWTRAKKAEVCCNEKEKLAPLVTTVESALKCITVKRHRPLKFMCEAAV